MTAKPQTKYAPLGTADVYGKDSAALFHGQWPLALIVRAIWVSTASEHPYSLWTVESRHEREGTDLAAERAWASSTKLMALQTSKPTVLHELQTSLLRRYGDETPLVMKPADIVRVRVRRGLFDHRRAPVAITVVLEVEEGKAL